MSIVKRVKRGSSELLSDISNACVLMLSILRFTGEDIIIMDIKDIPLDKSKGQ